MAVGKRLNQQKITRVISSPFQRAMQTSHYVALGLDGM